MSEPLIIDSLPPRSVHPLLLNICQLFWPELKTASQERRVIGVGEVLSTLYSAPLAVAGIIWLIAVTDLIWLKENWPLFILFGVLIFSFHQLRFFLIVELRENRYGSADGAMTGIPLWAGVLLYGPIMLWLPLFWNCVQFIIELRRAQSAAARWGQWRGISMSIASEILVPLVAFQFYLSIGGQFPFAELSVPTILLALVMFAIYFLLYAIFWLPYLAYHTWAQQALSRSRDVRPILKFFWLAVGLPQLANPFAILAAGIYAQNGMAVFLFLMSGMLMVAYLSRRMSWTTERSRQSSRLLEKLEALGRAIIDAPPDSENIHELLETHLVNMFPAGRLVVWIFPDDVLTQQPAEWDPNLDEIWPWLLNRSEGDVYLAGEELPWKKEPGGNNPVVVAPIRDVDEAQTFGGIYLELHTLSQPWNRRALKNLCPAVQALAAQIASALKQSQTYEQTLEYQKVSEELKLAGTIQASLLPNTFPDMDGWQFAVTLAPAGETSGDFFDIIPLAEGKIGFVIADVLDKGVGPAIYMTLSRTLIRTYATEFDLQPDLVFFATNERILKDTRANLFVTAFFGVLDPVSGKLTYCNAGHNPPYFLGHQNGCNPIPLEKTGFPIGIDEDATWERAETELNPGDVLVLYTDGVPDAQDLDGDFFKTESLVEVIQDHLGESAEMLQKSILDAVYDFVGDAPPFDDITLMVLRRDLQEEAPET
jgi:serine phosphatase RsbU (regulator of sigma subunit)